MLTLKFDFRATVLPILIGIFFASCDKVEETNRVHVTKPIYEKMASIRQVPISLTTDKVMESYGKIYIYQDYLFINEPLQGVHIYDNTNPRSPKAIGFINIPGNADMAIKNNTLYADSYVDMLVFDLSTPASPKLVKRLEDVFTSLYVYAGTNELTNVIVDYKDTVVSYKDQYNYLPMISRDVLANYSNAESANSYGQGGSMARFTLAKEYLYTVDESRLHLFDVSDTQAPSYITHIPLGWGIETIFPYKDNLFVGSNTGMFIYDITSPSSPRQLAHYSHATACDPVVVNDEFAYVTLRTGTACAGFVNVLEVLDIKDLTKPTLLKSYQMENPHGLGLSGDVLYLCEGKHGFKSFNVNDVLNIDKHLLQHIQSIHSVDVIPGPKSLIITGENGVCQYDYTNKDDIKLLSCISVNPLL